MKKGTIVFLILAGAALGYWMAQKNWKLFELAYRSEKPNSQALSVKPDVNRLKRGLEKWQVKEIMGPPESRSFITGNEGVKREVWQYGPRRLLFADGILLSWDKSAVNPRSEVSDDRKNAKGTAKQ